MPVTIDPTQEDQRRLVDNLITSIATGEYHETLQQLKQPLELLTTPGSYNITPLQALLFTPYHPDDIRKGVRFDYAADCQAYVAFTEKLRATLLAEGLDEKRLTELVSNTIANIQNEAEPEIDNDEEAQHCPITRNYLTPDNTLYLVNVKFKTVCKISADGFYSHCQATQADIPTLSPPDNSLDYIVNHHTLPGNLQAKLGGLSDHVALFTSLQGENFAIHRMSYHRYCNAHIPKLKLFLGLKDRKPSILHVYELTQDPTVLIEYIEHLIDDRSITQPHGHALATQAGELAALFRLHPDLLNNPQLLAAMNKLPDKNAGEYENCCAWYYMAKSGITAATNVMITISENPHLLDTPGFIKAMSAMRNAEAQANANVSTWAALIFRAKSGNYDRLLDFIVKHADKLLDNPAFMNAMSAKRTARAGEFENITLWAALLFSKTNNTTARFLTFIETHAEKLLANPAFIEAMSAKHTDKAGLRENLSGWTLLAQGEPETKARFLTFIETHAGKLLNNDAFMDAMSAKRTEMAEENENVSAWMVLAQGGPETQDRLLTFIETHAEILLANPAFMDAMAAKRTEMAQEDENVSAWMLLAQGGPETKNRLLTLIETHAEILLNNPAFMDAMAAELTYEAGKDNGVSAWMLLAQGGPETQDRLLTLIETHAGKLLNNDAFMDAMAATLTDKAGPNENVSAWMLLAQGGPEAKDRLLTLIETYGEELLDHFAFLEAMSAKLTDEAGPNENASVWTLLAQGRPDTQARLVAFIKTHAKRLILLAQGEPEAKAYLAAFIEPHAEILLADPAFIDAMSAKRTDEAGEDENVSAWMLLADGETGTKNRLLTLIETHAEMLLANPAFMDAMSAKRTEMAGEDENVSAWMLLADALLPDSKDRLLTLVEKHAEILLNNDAFMDAMSAKRTHRAGKNENMSAWALLAKCGKPEVKAHLAAFIKTHAEKLLFNRGFYLAMCAKRTHQARIDENLSAWALLAQGNPSAQAELLDLIDTYSDELLLNPEFFEAMSAKRTHRARKNENMSAWATLAFGGLDTQARLLDFIWYHAAKTLLANPFMHLFIDAMSAKRTHQAGIYENMSAWTALAFGELKTRANFVAFIEAYAEILLDNPAFMDAMSAKRTDKAGPDENVSAWAALSFSEPDTRANLLALIETHADKLLANPAFLEAMAAKRTDKAGKNENISAWAALAYGGPDARARLAAFINIHAEKLLTNPAFLEAMSAKRTDKAGKNENMSAWSALAAGGPNTRANLLALINTHADKLLANPAFMDAMSAKLTDKAGSNENLSAWAALSFSEPDTRANLLALINTHAEKLLANPAFLEAMSAKCTHQAGIYENMSAWSALAYSGPDAQARLIAFIETHAEKLLDNPAFMDAMSAKRTDKAGKDENMSAWFALACAGPDARARLAAFINTHAEKLLANPAFMDAMSAKRTDKAGPSENMSAWSALAAGGPNARANLLALINTHADELLANPAFLEAMSAKLTDKAGPNKNVSAWTALAYSGPDAQARLVAFIKTHADKLLANSDFIVAMSTEINLPGKDGGANRKLCPWAKLLEIKHFTENAALLQKIRSALPEGNPAARLFSRILLPREVQEVAQEEAPLGAAAAFFAPDTTAKEGEAAEKAAQPPPP